jgi:predicted DNA-binding transcriptional regulator AlpA
MVTRLLRFRDLKERGIVPSWTMLRIRIDQHGFPPGRMIGPNTRAWTEEEIDVWVKSRPAAGAPALKGAARIRHARKAQAAARAAAE